MVEFSPATREARVRFPDVASFIILQLFYFYFSDLFVSAMKSNVVYFENLESFDILVRPNFHRNDRAEHITAALIRLSKIILKSKVPGLRDPSRTVVPVQGVTYQ